MNLNISPPSGREIGQHRVLSRRTIASSAISASAGTTVSCFRRYFEFVRRSCGLLARSFARRDPEITAGEVDLCHREIRRRADTAAPCNRNRIRELVSQSVSQSRTRRSNAKKRNSLDFVIRLSAAFDNGFVQIFNRERERFHRIFDETVLPK